MKILALVLALIAPVVSAQGVNTIPPAQEVDICTVTANAANYDGKEIVVRGLWKMVFHGSIFKGKACPAVLVNLTQVPEYKANKKASSLVWSLAKKDQFGLVEVVFRGTFRAAHREQCFGQICTPYQFEAVELLSAQAVTP
jgi:hypothetical protein